MALETGNIKVYPETNRVIRPGETYGGIDDRVLTPVLAGVDKTPTWWWIGFGISAALLVMYLVSVVKLITTGIGIFGNNIPVAWGMPIINFVWWIGIGHAGTLISAGPAAFPAAVAHHRQPLR